ncbi:fasciclin domain-containing protein [Glycomyces sp. TRM65418]|uniref:fasciclin domain-containing protein n=1 Tax=Glycomyces sp. TRM65418 TaxID=2867006 RepID=UPI001CE703F3|nr:fasciclin domain-containing protein [Glycomyces sp. TRM65418]MCC3764245.1 fasciclin domain-containing protein [Glycomyces sp. TRM65418]QZD53928.1 fasciclin domain-containing protein [Glycomyces sp. TRM65418]
MNHRFLTRAGALAAAAGFAITMSACGSDGEDASGEDTTSAEETMAEEETTESMPASGEFGAACSAVPADGEGSFTGMADDPVATAASNNPVLSTLVTAVSEADLVDTLNSAENITVFAPTNDAFAAIPEADLEAVLADKDLLTSILTYHVVGEEITPEELSGTFTTLQGATLEVSGSGEAFTVNGSSNVVCGNVQTANATVYIVDSVLMPA